MKFQRLRLPVILGSAVMLGGWYGYHAERARVQGAGSRPPTVASVVRHTLAGRETADATRRLDELRNRAGRKPLTPAETAACWEIVRSFTVKQVQHYLADLPQGERNPPANDTLVEMLDTRWVQLDAEGAATAATRDGWILLLMNVWVSRDPEAALRWSKKDPKLEPNVAAMLGRLYAVEDPTTALTRAEAVGPVAVAQAMSMLAQQMSGSEESRQAFLKLIEGQKGTREGSAAVGSMVEGWLERDPAGALEGLGGYGEDSTRLRAIAVEQLSSSAPDIAMTWMRRNPAGLDVAEVQNYYTRWAQNYPDEATDWAVKNGRPEYLSQAVQEKAKILLVNGWDAQTGTDYRFTGFQTQVEVWRRQQPQEAEAWLATMPSVLRNSLAR